MILADPRNPLARRHEAELRRRELDLPDDVRIVVGGDGFMLHTVAEHGFDALYLGVNAGRIGFLMNDPTDWDAFAERVRRRAWRAYEFPVLEATLTCADGRTRTITAVNDVALERSTGQTAHLGLSIDGNQVVEVLVADGLIVSTALGSTAYAFSAGGPAAHPTLRMVEITAICPHHPRLSPFLLPEDATTRIDVRAADRRPVRAVADGTTLEDVVAAEVRAHPNRFRLAWLEGHDLTHRMVTKILRP